MRNAEKYTLHSLRRGAAQELLSKGGDLAVLLKAGGWRSSAFRAYMDEMDIQNTVATANLQTLLDIDGVED